MTAESPAGVYDMTIYRGDTFGKVFTFQNDAVPAVPIDITGRTYKAYLRLASDLSTGTPALQFTCTVTDAVNGELTVSASAAQTAVLDPKSLYSWDLQETVSGNVYTVLAGTVTVERDVTQ